LIFFSCGSSSGFRIKTPLMRLRNHTHWTHPTRHDFSERMIGPKRRPLPDNTQRTTHHCSCGNRTHNPGKRSAADPRLIPHGPWDRLD